MKKNKSLNTTTCKRNMAKFPNQKFKPFFNLVATAESTRELSHY